MLVFLLCIPLSSVLTKPSPLRLSLIRNLESSVRKEYSPRFQFHILDKHVAPSERKLDILNRNTKRTLYDGDMIVSDAFLQDVVRENEKHRWWRPKRQAYKDRSYPSTIWQDGVPFVFDGNLSDIAVASIQKAMDFWESETCVTFRPRDNESHYLYFTGEDSGCYSYVGRDPSREKQNLNIGKGCHHFGVTSHEVAHALGLFHHQQRYDRDNHIIFVSGNVAPLYLSNFAKLPRRFLNTYFTPYDYGSVMHYTPTEFSNDRYKPSLLAADENFQGVMGSMDKPSFIDVLLMNRHYHCSQLCANVSQPRCLNGGYVNPLNCTLCKCPTGFGGNLCEKIEPSESEKCGGLLPASYNLRKVKIVIKAGLKRRQCVYQIRAPFGRRVMIGIENIKGKCQEGCYTTGMEAKMRGDFRPVGYRFCCQAHSFRRLVSIGSAVPLTFFAQNGTLEANIFFRWIIDSPDAEDTTLLSEKEMSEVYSQRSGDEDIDMHVLEDPIREVFVAPPLYDEVSHDEATVLEDSWGGDGESFTDFSVYE